MSIESSFSFDLYPGLDDGLQAALERNVASGAASPDAIAKSGLAAVVAEQVQEADQLPNPNVGLDFSLRVDKAFAAARELFGFDWLDLDKVEVLRNGTALDNLSRLYEAMQEADLKPEAIVAPRALDIQFWQNLYGSLPGTKNGGLHLDKSVRDSWSWLNRGEGWSISVVSSTPEPPVTNISHDLLHAKGNELDKVRETFTNFTGVHIKPGNSIIRGHYPTISEYLTLQALHLKAGQPPIDAKTKTWLGGTYDQDARAPHARWHSRRGQVYAEWLHPDLRSGDLGVRPTVRA